MKIDDTNIEIPDSLVVEGDLDLMNTNIKVLHEGLSVGDLYANDGQLIASETIQLELIEKNEKMIHVLKAPT